MAGALAVALAVTCSLLAPRAREVSLPGRHPDMHALGDAGWPRSLWEWEGIRAVCVVVAAALAFSVGFPPAAAMFAAVIAPSIAARSRAQTARRRSRLGTTRLVRATEAGLRSGRSLAEALRRAIDASDDPLARRPFADALREFDLGAPLDEALRSSASRAQDGRVRMAVETLAIGVASRLPGDRAAVLVGAVADRLAFEERLEEEVRARTSGLRSQVLLLAAIVPALSMYLALTVPSLGATLAGPLGRTVLVPAAIALEVIGVLATRRAFAGRLR